MLPSEVSQAQAVWICQKSGVLKERFFVRIPALPASSPCHRAGSTAPICDQKPPAHDQSMGPFQLSQPKAGTKHGHRWLHCVAAQCPLPTQQVPEHRTEPCSDHRQQVSVKHFSSCLSLSTKVGLLLGTGAMGSGEGSPVIRPRLLGLGTAASILTRNEGFPW